MICPCEKARDRCTYRLKYADTEFSLCLPCSPNKEAAYHEGSRLVKVVEDEEGNLLSETYRCADCGTEWTV